MRRMIERKNKNGLHKLSVLIILRIVVILLLMGTIAKGEKFILNFDNTQANVGEKENNFSLITEPIDNIEKSISHKKDLVAHSPITYNFTTLELPIYEIVVMGENDYEVTIKIEVLKNTSKLVGGPPPGEVYKNMNILSSSKRIKEIWIRFKVENSWLTRNYSVNYDARMSKWESSKWTNLETAEKTKDGTFTYYEAKTDSFSPFAITGFKGAVTPNEIPVIQPNEKLVTETPQVTIHIDPTQVVTRKPGANLLGLAYIYSLIAVTLMLALVIIIEILNMRREKK